MYTVKTNGAEVELRAVEKGIFRVRVSHNGEFEEGLLSRYNILRESGEAADAAFDGESLALGAAKLSPADGGLDVSGTRAPVHISFDGYEGKPYKSRGFTLKVSLAKDERLFGLGDESRKSIARRGSVARLDIRNIASYGPMPFIMSSNGWGLLLNCTYASTFDCGAADADNLVIASHKGQIDFYLFIPESGKLTDILMLQGKIAGNPILMPKFAYGYTFVLNEQTNAREMLYDCLNFRREDISCDMVGLEPQWMTNHYDRSIYKTWSRDRFFFPDWMPERITADMTHSSTICARWASSSAFGSVRTTTFCLKKSVSAAKEQRSSARSTPLRALQFFYHPHLACPEYMDGITVRDVPWFDHLKKFCDNGASAFKLDGAFQTNDHPDRLWGGKYFDDEVHNVYPVIYVKQMQEGFNNHTGRRAVIYTPCVYSGTQRYAASWRATPAADLTPLSQC